MQLGENILEGIVRREGIVDFDGLKELFELECFRLLARIKEILDDGELEDEECFWKIEAIVSAFEEAGYACDGRHDF